jgi:hypothetical protein
MGATPVSYTYLVDPGVAAYWAFDEAGGDTVFDSGPNGYDGTLVNGVSRVTGRIGAALGFDGIDDYVDVPEFNWPAGGPVTVSFWSYVDSSLRTSSAFGVGTDSGNRVQVHARWSDGVLYFDYGNTKDRRISTDYTGYLDRWTHVVLVSEGNGGSFKGIYLDGTLVASSAVSDGPDVALAGLTLGTWGARHYRGSLDDFRIWSRVLSEVEVLSLYDSGLNADGT